MNKLKLITGFLALAAIAYVGVLQYVKGAEYASSIIMFLFMVNVMSNESIKKDMRKRIEELETENEWLKSNADEALLIRCERLFEQSEKPF